MDRIGVAAVEDDGIYFTVAEVDERLVGEVRKPDPVRRPKDGYSSRFIVDTMLERLGPLVATREIGQVAISMFGQMNLDDGKLEAVPRFDYQDGQLPLDFGGLFGGFPVYVGHDSSTAALGEWLYRKNESGFNPDLFVRIRVGVGVGVGFVNGNGHVQTRRGSHPEGGHLPIFRGATTPRGTCRAHSKEEWDCIEGLISEQTIRRECNGAPLVEIPLDHPVWKSVTQNLAVLCIAITTLSLADTIVIGGRTMIDTKGEPREGLLKRIQDDFQKMIGGYPGYEVAQNVQQYIFPSRAVPNPAWVSVLGVAELARRTLYAQQF